MRLSHHTQRAIEHALVDPAASHELIRLLDGTAKFIDEHPQPQGEPVESKPGPNPAKVVEAVSAPIDTKAVVEKVAPAEPTATPTTLTEPPVAPPTTAPANGPAAK